MKILTWNCGGGLRGKVDRARALDADLQVIQEGREQDLPREVPGFARNARGTNKGMVVWARRGWQIAPHPAWREDSGFQQVTPLCVVPPREQVLTVLAVWTHSARRHEEAYIGQLHLALDAYEQLLGPRSIVLGDFNSNARWDSERRRNHSGVVERLASRGLTSAYHRWFDEPQGSETRPTHWLTRNALRPFHLDYVFSSADLPAREVTLGSYEQWCRKKDEGGVSDHAPMAVTLGTP